jgi:tRNA-(ms[2]io[6]A)-hydroxylase
LAKIKILPLRYLTPSAWTALPLSNPRALLSDHAYLERKAASNALELLNRWPEPKHPENWAPTMSSIARDEALHLNQVMQFMTRRGWKLERLHRSDYAGDLRKLVRMGRGPEEIVDRLLVSALIEARSCERFRLIGEHSDDTPLAKFYTALAAAEFGHYAVFLSLAKAVLPAKTVRQRWSEMLDEEAAIAQRQPAGPGLHSGLG